MKHDCINREINSVNVYPEHSHIIFKMSQIVKFTKILRLIHHENVTIDDIIEFRSNNPQVEWPDIIYKETGDSILHVAARLGKEDILNYILNTWPPKNVDIQNNDCKTPLHEAAQFCQPFTVDILLENGAKVNAIKRADWTPLMLACTKSGDDSFKTIVMLVSKNADLTLVNKDGWNVLHLACRTGDLRIFQYLLSEFDGNLEQRTKNGRTMLHVACLHGHFSVVKTLLELCDINVNSEDNCGSTPFLDGICANSIEICNYLISKGADKLAQNKVGLSAVHLAASEGLTNMLEYVLNDLKIDPNIVTPSNMSALHYAARKNQHESIEMLIKHGANELIKDSHGRMYKEYLTL